MGENKDFIALASEFMRLFHDYEILQRDKYLLESQAMTKAIYLQNNNVFLKNIKDLILKLDKEETLKGLGTVINLIDKDWFKLSPKKIKFNLLQFLHQKYDDKELDMIIAYFFLIVNKKHSFRTKMIIPKSSYYEYRIHETEIPLLDTLERLLPFLTGNFASVRANHDDDIYHLHKIFTNLSKMSLTTSKYIGSKNLKTINDANLLGTKIESKGSFHYIFKLLSVLEAYALKKRDVPYFLFFLLRQQEVSYSFIEHAGDAAPGPYRKETWANPMIRKVHYTDIVSPYVGLVHIFISKLLKQTSQFQIFGGHPHMKDPCGDMIYVHSDKEVHNVQKKMHRVVNLQKGGVFICDLKGTGLNDESSKNPNTINPQKYEQYKLAISGMHQYFYASLDHYLKLQLRYKNKRWIHSVKDLLLELNRRIKVEMPFRGAEATFLATSYLELNEDMSIRMLNFGQNLGVVYRSKSNKCEYTNPKGLNSLNFQGNMPMGIAGPDDTKLLRRYKDNEEKNLLRMEIGDVFVVVTDGMTELMRNGKVSNYFSSPEFMKIISAYHKHDPQAIYTRIIQSVEENGYSFFDDATIVVLKIVSS